ncbi:phosphopantetheine-binding protein [Micromonospora sp. CPCC 205371]|nr:phosphopantetheine-binding protein [Micromonospora sp. CPCC 205371]
MEPSLTIHKGTVVDSIRVLLPRVLRRDVPAADEDTKLMEDLGLSSSTTLELMLELEERLDIQIDVEDIDQDDFATVGTLAEFVASHLLPAE